MGPNPDSVTTITHPMLRTFESSISLRECLSDMGSSYSFSMTRAVYRIPLDIVNVSVDSSLFASYKAARGVKNEYTHAGSTTYGFGVICKTRFLWIDMSR